MEAMESLINSIREAAAENASEQARAAGAQACRTILAAFEAKRGQPLAPVVHAAPAVNAIVSLLRNTPPDQLLELAIAKLKAALPADTTTDVQSVRIPLVSIGALEGRS